MLSEIDVLDASFEQGLLDQREFDEVDSASMVLSGFLSNMGCLSSDDRIVEMHVYCRHIGRLYLGASRTVPAHIREALLLLEFNHVAVHSRMGYGCPKS